MVQSTDTCFPSHISPLGTGNETSEVAMGHEMKSSLECDLDSSPTPKESTILVLTNLD